MASPSLDEFITEIEQWFADTMHGSVVSRDVVIYNHVHAAYEDLKNRIATMLTGKPLSAPMPTAEEPVEAAPALDKTEPKSKPPA